MEADNIAHFCEITGATPEQAQNYLEVSQGQVDAAINLFMESGGAELSANDQTASSSSLNPVTSDEPRAAIAPTRDVLIDDIYNRQDQSKALEQERLEENNPFGRDSGNDRLARLFAPPDKIMFRGNFDQAREFARNNAKWVMVTIHDPQEFPCQMLNRDLWKDKKVEEIIQENFVFLQFQYLSHDGKLYRNFYPFDNLPHIAIIDPRTGERMKTWDIVVQPTEMMVDLLDFLDSNTLEISSKAKQSIGAEELSEEEQIARAISESVQTASGDKSNPIVIDDDHIEIEAKQRPDPPAGADTTTLQFRLPEGRRLVKKFEKSDTVRVLFEHLRAVEDQFKDKPFDIIFHRESLKDKLESSLKDANVLASALNVDFL